MDAQQIEHLTGGVRLARLVLQERRMAKAAGLMKLAGLAKSLHDSDQVAGGLADRLMSAVGGLQQEMGVTTSIVETVEAARDHLRAINQAILPGNNGGPPLDSPSSSESPVGSRPSETANLGTTKAG